MFALNPQPLQFGLERDPAAPGVGSEDGAVVGEQRFRKSVNLAGGDEAVEHVSSLKPGDAVGGEEEPGMVVEDVEDLHLAAVSQAPEGDVGLPELVGEVGLETNEG